ncbi:hypothetical protein SAMN02745111_01670 [Eubacterium uniforme]|uniref:Uncharacterized protein n=1 Tax=Eubacterium uniforme TaxID=39495 RepID=A0A1T4VVB8_9FIRM|nr:hypothetical protein [Eubacterium uniforme]SKA68896.1 hypothetical protein SAMN02745111_01670 [Eubacterium uniforme]
MFFDGGNDNTLYENLVVNDDLKEQMLKACMEAKSKELESSKGESEKRERKRNGKSTYGNLFAYASVAIVSIVVSGLLIIAGIGKIKNSNSGGVSPRVGKESETITEKTTETVNETESNIKETENKDGYVDIRSVVEQFSRYRNKWDHEFDEYILETGIKYTMTDLDHNGNPELITSAILGDAMISEIHIFELMDGKIINRTEGMSMENTMEMPDVTLFNEFVTYYDSENNVYYYECPDYSNMRGGKHPSSMEQSVIFKLSDGVFAVEGKQTKNENDGEVIYRDEKNNIITEKEFKTLNDKVMCEQNGYEKKTTKIQWTELKDIYELVDCYKTFINEN